MSNSTALYFNPFIAAGFVLKLLLHAIDGILYKCHLDCAPIFSYASKLSFCVIYVPILHAVFVKGIDIQGSQTVV